MPIFSRRRLQVMLDDLLHLVDVAKLNDLRARLENKRASQAVPAEFELGVLWALSKMGEIEVEPDWYGSRRPDAYTEHLFEGQPCAVEITAVSDARLSQEEDMRRVATRLCEVDLPPDFRASLNLVKSAFEGRSGHEEAIHRRADHRVPQAGAGWRGDQGPVSQEWV